MTGARRATVLALVLATAPLGGPSVVAAQMSESARYRALVSEAISEFDARHWEEARALFLRANEITPNARPLRGAGMASFEMRAYVDAWRYLTRALAETRRPLTRSQRREVQRLLVRAETFIGRARIRVDPPSGTLTIDLREAAPEEDGTYLLDVGSHAVRATAPGYEPASSNVTIEPTEITDLTIALERAGPRVVRVERADDGPSVDAASAILLGGGGALAVGAIIGIFWIKGRDSAIERCDAVATSSFEECLNGNTLSVERTVAIGATVALAAGAVALTTIGMVRLARGSGARERDDGGSARVDCGLSLSGVVCAGRF